MAAVDAAWYHIDGPANLALVTGILVTRKPLDFDRVRDLYRYRLRRSTGSTNVSSRPGFPSPTSLEDVPHFDIDQHLHHLALPAPQDGETLMALLSDLASTPLDASVRCGRCTWSTAWGTAAASSCASTTASGRTAMMALAQELFDTSPDAPLDRGAGRAEPSAAPPDNEGCSIGCSRRL